MSGRPVLFGPETGKKLLALANQKPVVPVPGERRQQTINVYFVKATAATISESVSAGAGVTVNVSSTDGITVGCVLHFDTESVTVTGVGSGTITADFAEDHDNASSFTIEDEGRIAGTRYEYIADSDTFIARDAVWIVEVNELDLDADAFYQAVRAGTWNGRPTWLVNNESGAIVAGSGAASGPVYAFVRTGVLTISAAGSTVTFNGPTFATGTTGTDFNVSVSSNAVTHNLPDASQTNRGVVNTTTQEFKGNKSLYGSWSVYNATHYQYHWFGGQFSFNRVGVPGFPDLGWVVMLGAPAEVARVGWNDSGGGHATYLDFNHGYLLISRPLANTRFGVTDSSGSSYLGAYATVGGLEFKGGLFTGGGLEVETDDIEPGTLPTGVNVDGGTW